MAKSRTRSKKPQAIQADGDCYEAAFKFIMDNCMFDPDARSKYVLVHAEVMGQGPLEGVSYGHAFVIKDGTTVIDRSNGRNIQMPVSVYYAIGRINDIGNEHRYTWSQIKEKALLDGTYGPWDLVTSTGL